MPSDLLRSFRSSELHAIIHAAFRDWKKICMTEKTTVEREGFQSIYYDGTSRNLALIIVSGSDGGLRVADATAKRFSAEGIPSLAVAYYKTSQTSSNLAEIPVEYVEHAIDWLRKKGFSKIAIHGISKGAEYALVSASLLPAISGVIALSGSCCVFGGLSARRRAMPTSSWSWRGKPLPYLSMGDAHVSFAKMLLQYGELRLVDFYNHLLDTGRTEENTIKAEHIQGPILLQSGHEDSMWPAEEMSNIITQRLSEKAFPYRYEHHVFSPGGHLLSPMSSPMLGLYKLERKDREGCSAARERAFANSLSFLKALQLS